MQTHDDHSKMFAKLCELPKMSAKTLFSRLPDSRLTSPFSIIDDPGMKFGEYDEYPEQLSIVACFNGL